MSASAASPEPSAPRPSPAEPSSAKPSPVLFRLPGLPDALASFLRTIVIALFVVTFLLQPFLIPSESMERTLLVGDFLLFNKQIYAPANRFTRWLMPYRDVERGDIVVFHHAQPAFLVKRVVGVPGDRLRIDHGRVLVDGVPLDEPYVAMEPAPPSSFRDNFPPRLYTDPQVDPDWWRLMQSLTTNGELSIPQGEYFVLGDNRNHSMDSRFWGFVPRSAIIARPLVIYFSVTRPSTTDVEQASDQALNQSAGQAPGQAPGQANDDRLGHDSEIARWKRFARWDRILSVVH